MSENKQPVFEALLKQIDDFEKTISDLASNVARLKDKLLQNKEKYGADISKWPNEAK